MLLSTYSNSGNQLVVSVNASLGRFDLQSVGVHELENFIRVLHKFEAKIAPPYFSSFCPTVDE